MATIYGDNNFLPTNLLPHAHLIALIDGNQVVQITPIPDNKYMVIFPTDTKEKTRGVLVDYHAADQVYLGFKGVQGVFFSYVELRVHRANQKLVEESLSWALKQTIEVRVSLHEPLENGAPSNVKIK